MQRLRLTGLSLIMAGLVACSVSAQDTPGLQATAPADGPSIKTDKGYMVPYTVTIPGSDVTFDMVPIPGGTFTMGSPDSEDDRQDNEGPQFKVEMEPYWMAKCEVRWAEYKQYMALYGIFKEMESRKIREVNEDNMIDAITAPTELYDPSFTFEFGEEPELPAVTMTYYAARQYTKWMSAVTGAFYRLPSEAEWEYACRAGTETAYSFGDDPDDLEDYAWYYDNSDEGPSPVGQKKPNPWGLHDMHGNVAEWCLDEVLEDGYAKFGGKAVKAADALVWPTQLTSRAIRGGSWEDDPENCRSAFRLPSEEDDWKMEDPNLPLSPWWFTSDPTRGVGFRMVRPLTAPADKELKEKFWKADDEETRDGVNNRLQEGRGGMGLVDKDLPAAIDAMK